MKKKRQNSKKVSRRAIPNTSNKKDEVSWQAPEFSYHHKGIVWWTIFILALATLFAFAYLIANWWMMAFIAFTALIILMHSFRQPRIILCKLDHKGLKIGKRFYIWNELVSFWFIPQTSEPYVTLYLKTTSRLLPMTSTEVSWKEIDLVYKFFAKRIPVEEQGEPFFDKVGRLLKL